MFQEERDSDHSSKKKRKHEDSSEAAEESKPAPVQNMISKEQIKAMMSQAKAHITQRKQDLHIQVCEVCKTPTAFPNLCQSTFIV